MSAAHLAAILEWSQVGVRSWTPGAQGIHEHSSLAEAVQALGLRGKPVGIAISRRQIFLRAMKLPNASKEEAMVVLKLQLDQAFPIPASDLALDFCFVGEPTPDGRPALVAAMKAEGMRSLLAEASSAGIKPLWVAPSSLGSQLLAKTHQLGDALIMEATEEGLAIDVIEKGRLTASRIAGSRANSIDIVAEAARTQAAYKLENPQMVLAGGLAGPSGALSLKESSLSSLAAQAPEISLQLPEQAARLEMSKINTRRRIGIVLWLAAAVVGGLIVNDRMELSDQVAKIQKDFQRQERNIKQSTSRFTSRLSTSGQNAVILANAFEPAQAATDVVAVATNLLPQGAWLTGINYERGRRLQLKGTSLKSEGVSDYVDALAAESRFRDAQLVFANNIKVEDTPVVQFSISLHVVGNLPLDDKALLRSAQPASRSTRSARSSRTTGAAAQQTGEGS